MFVLEEVDLECLEEWYDCYSGPLPFEWNAVGSHNNELTS